MFGLLPGLAMQQITSAIDALMSIRKADFWGSYRHNSPNEGDCARLLVKVRAIIHSGILLSTELAALFVGPVYGAVNKFEIETGRETQRHKDTEAQRKRRNKICYLRRFLCASVSLCLCVSSRAHI
jgi:hypothetical protein